MLLAEFALSSITFLPSLNQGEHHFFGSHGVVLLQRSYLHYTWKTPTWPEAYDPALYFRNIEKAEALIGTGLFRPPYGHLRPSQAPYLQKHYQVVLWDVISGDFDPRLSP